MSLTAAPSDDHISSFACRSNPRALHADRVTLAYDRLKFPALVEELSRADASLERRRNALRAICEELGPSVSFALAAEADAAPALVEVLAQPDDLSRERAARALGKLCANPTGRRHVLAAPGALKSLAAALNDPVQAHREQLLAALAALAEEEEGVDALVAAGYVPLLTALLAREPARVQALALQVLEHLGAQVGGAACAQALRAGLVRACVELCGSSGSRGVRQRAAANIAALAVREDGKAEALEAGAVAALCGLLSDPGERVVLEATRALMNVTVLNAAKRQAIELGALATLAALLERRDVGLRLNVTKALSNLAADPAGRAALRDSAALDTAGRLRHAADPLVAESARVLYDVIMWEP